MGSSRRRAHHLVPEPKHRPGQRVRAILGKKQSAVRDLDHALGARDGVFEPISPLFVEEDVIEAPHDAIMRAWVANETSCAGAISL